MKMTSGKRKQVRQGTALDRLLAQDPARWCTGTDPVRDAQWEERRQREIATLKKRTGRF